MAKKKRSVASDELMSDEEYRSAFNAFLEADLDFEEINNAKRKQARSEWVVFYDSWPGPSFHFYVSKQGRSIYYDENGDIISISNTITYLCKETFTAERKAQVLADRLNKDPDLAQALYEYTWERDIGKNDNAMTVAKRNAKAGRK
jgi:hypothetical protein